MSESMDLEVGLRADIGNVLIKIEMFIKVTPSSLEVRWESDWSSGLVPKQIASVLVRFRARSLWMNQL